ncbi:MAG: PfkB family carbohydrate kinase [Thioalkalivibrionaceae bacterium]
MSTEPRFGIDQRHREDASRLNVDERKSAQPSVGAILVVGEALFDVFPETSNQPARQVLGGASLNVAWNLAQMGVNARFVGGIGDDDAAQRLRARLATLKPRTVDGTVVVDRPTGRVDVHFDRGEPSYVIPPDQAFDHLPDTVVDELIEGFESGDFSWLYHGSLAFRSKPMQTVLERLIRAAPRRFFDVNLRSPWFSLDHIHKTARGADIVKLNAAEWVLLDPSAEAAMNALTSSLRRHAVNFSRSDAEKVGEGEAGKDLRRLDNAPFSVVMSQVYEAAISTAEQWALKVGLVVTLGEHGALWVDYRGARFFVAPEPEWLSEVPEPADALSSSSGSEAAQTVLTRGNVVGAGDAFSAALLAEWSAVGVRVTQSDAPSPATSALGSAVSNGVVDGWQETIGGVMRRATRYAGAVTCIEGATTSDTAWYASLVASLPCGKWMGSTSSVPPVNRVSYESDFAGAGWEPGLSQGNDGGTK